MRLALLWLSRIIAALLIIYGLWIAYETWAWTRMGLHQRVYDGESQSEIELNVDTYAIFHAPSMRFAGLFLLSGVVMMCLTFTKSQRRD